MYDEGAETALPPDTIYMLPKALLPIVFRKQNDIYFIEVGEPKYIGATEAPYNLRYRPSAFASDTVTFEIDGGTGLLKSIHMKAEDKLDDIVVKIAESVVALETAVQAGPAEELLKRDLDPSDPDAVALLQNDLNDVFDGDGQIIFRAEPATSFIAGPAPDCTVGVCYRMPVPYHIGFGFEGTEVFSTIVGPELSG